MCMYVYIVIVLFIIVLFGDVFVVVFVVICLIFNNGYNEYDQEYWDNEYSFYKIFKYFEQD